MAPPFTAQALEMTGFGHIDNKSKNAAVFKCVWIKIEDWFLFLDFIVSLQLLLDKICSNFSITFQTECNYHRGSKHEQILSFQNLSVFYYLSKQYIWNTEDACLMVIDITKTSPCNEHPLTPHFYIAKLGFTGVFIFSYFCSKTLIVGTR